MKAPVGFERFRPWYAALRQGGAADPISILGAKLAAWLTSRGSTLYDLASGGVPATVSGPVGLREDQSGNGRDATQSTATARPTWDGTALVYDPDDALNITLPAISGGQIVISSPVGIWIGDIPSFGFVLDEDTEELVPVGGTFSLGPTTYTNGPAGLWSLLGNAEMQVCILDDAMTNEEQTALVAYLVAQGSPGLINLGAELKSEFAPSASGDAIATYDSGTDVWSISRTASGTGEFRRVSSSGNYLVDAEWLSGDQFLFRADTSTIALTFNSINARRIGIVNHTSGRLAFNNGAPPHSSTFRIHSVKRVILP